jgi:hypothetical protein
MNIIDRYLLTKASLTALQYHIDICHEQKGDYYYISYEDEYGDSRILTKGIHIFKDNIDLYNLYHYNLEEMKIPNIKMPSGNYVVFKDLTNACDGLYSLSLMMYYLDNNFFK